MYACLAVTCHLHFWQNDRDFLRATVVTRGWNGYRNKSQHRKSTLEKKILPPFQQGFEPATFQSRVRRSNHWAIPAPTVYFMWCREFIFELAVFFFAGQPGWLSPVASYVTPTVGGGEKVLTRRQEVIKTLNQQRRLIFSTPHSFDSISCTPSRSNHLQAKLIRFFFCIIIC